MITYHECDRLDVYGPDGRVVLSVSGQGRVTVAEGTDGRTVVMVGATQAVRDALREKLA